MSSQDEIIFGIDLGTTYSCISYVDEYGKAVVIPNKEHSLTTPSVVLFEGENRVVGEEAKNNAMLSPDGVVEMVKRHMGEPDWRFSYNGYDYTAEEISSYILRKLAADTQESLTIPVKDVVITCPAYFGIAQREATARAGQIAGFNVREVINEPTAAAITYGLQNEQDQVVLVYDLGGGTFDVTVIEIKDGAITVVATGGDHNLGGRNWDEAIVIYLAEQWRNETGSSDEPTDSAETLQDLWLKAEKAKHALTPRNETKVAVTHAGQVVRVTLTRDKFNELTASLLDRTIMYTKFTIEEAQARGYSHFNQILLVGGSTKMPQVAERLKQEFGLPYKMFEPDEAVAKGAATYGQKLLIDGKIQSAIETMTGTAADELDATDVAPSIVRRAEQEVANDLGLRLASVQKYHKTSVTNVASHSFGIIVVKDSGTPKRREVISNLVVVNDPLPAAQTRQYGTEEDDQGAVVLQIMETTEKTEIVEQDKYTKEAEIGNAVLTLPLRLPANSAIEVTCELNRQGRLHVVGREPISGAIIEATIETRGGITEGELQEAKARASKIAIS
ncbi:MAG: Hsp70 family protein [Ktedonobacteraceae bacterium]